MQVYRTKFKNEIISEFVVPEKKTNKVLIICGGMPGYPEKRKYGKIAKEFLAKGFWIFVPRYRGCWESGGKLFDDSPSKDIKDVMDCLEKPFSELWNNEKFVIKNPQFYLYGVSFGGPAVLLNSKDKRVKKVIANSPVIDWLEEEKTDEPISKLSVFVKEAFGFGYRIAKNGWKKLEKGNFFNPAGAIDDIDGKKCLVIHAEDDMVVSSSPVKPFCQKTGAKLILLKKGGHGLNIMEYRLKKRCFEFLGI